MSEWAIFTPELRRVPSAQERQEAITLLSTGGGLAAFGAAGLVGIGSIIVLSCMGIRADWKVLLPAFGLPCAVAAFVTRRRNRRRIRFFLNRIGVPTCIACGYDARRIESETCPECGADLPAQPYREAHRSDLDPKLAEASWRATVALGRLRAQGWDALSRRPPGIQVERIVSRSGDHWTMETLCVSTGGSLYSSFDVQVTVLTAPTRAVGSELLGCAEGLVPAVRAG
ncbi:MAG: hypothetical protein U0625_00305 [Phycisphaerales bacterium]